MKCIIRFFSSFFENLQISTLTMKHDKMQLKKIVAAMFLLAMLPVLALAQWKPLFNGKNLDGWNQKNGKAIYKVENGEITGATVANTPNSFL